MSEHIAFAIRQLEASVQSALDCQCADPGSAQYGAVEGTLQGYTEAHSGGVYTARTLLLGYYTPGCRYEGDALLLERAMLALEYSLGRQHKDGTFDLLETNFHDGAETSFIAQTICPVALMLKRCPPKTELEDRVRGQLDRLIGRIADGIVNGGFHTPNHRWVMSAALGMCHALTGRQDCLDKMNALLREGIDCDGEGEYTERSSGVYNIICDRALITLSEVCGLHGLLEHVQRNLRMVIKYFEPDLTVNTVNSTRQDAGTAPDWRIYYGLYLFMALRTGDREFRWIADRMLEQSESAFSWAARQSGQGMMPYFEYLSFVLMDPSLRKEWRQDETCPPSFDFVQHFVASGIVRARKGDTSLTLIRENPVFAVLKHRRHQARLRLAGTFYSRGQFEAQRISEMSGGFELAFQNRWGYKGPLPEAPETSVWRLMDHSRRPDVMMQDYLLSVRVWPVSGGARFHISARGVENVLMKLEILLEGGARYSTACTEMHTRPGDYIFQKQGDAEYIYPDRTVLRILGGSCTHLSGRAMRGTLPGNDRDVFIALSAQTPWEQDLELRFEG